MSWNVAFRDLLIVRRLFFQLHSFRRVVSKVWSNLKPTNFLPSTASTRQVIQYQKAHLAVAEAQGRCLLEAYPVEHQQLLLSRLAVPRPLRLWVKDTMLYFGTQKQIRHTHLTTYVCTNSRNILHLLAFRSFHNVYHFWEFSSMCRYLHWSKQ